MRRTLLCVVSLIAVGCSGAPRSRSSSTSTSTSGSGATGGTSGASGTSTSTGTSGSFTPGPHAAWPQVPFHGGPTIAHPRVVTVTYDAYDARGDVEAWGTWVAGSDWLQAVGADYGVGTGTNVNAHLSSTPPQTLDDTPAAGQLTDLQSTVDALLGNTLPAPDDSTVYLLYFPSSTTITFGGDQSCSAFAAYHGAFTTRTQSPARRIYYLVIPECAPGAHSGLTQLAHTERAASHELIEAATDPDPLNTGWRFNDSNSPWHHFGGEVADLCQEASLYTDPTGQFVARRVWSNTAAAGNSPPCAPFPATASAFAGASPAAPYDGSVISVPAGKSVTLTVDGWSTEPIGAWSVDLVHPAGTESPFSLVAESSVSLTNAGTAQFTISVPPLIPSGSSETLELVSHATGAVDTMPWMVQVVVP